MIPNSCQPLTREQMAWRAAQDLMEGDYVNLGIGIPTLGRELRPGGPRGDLPQRERHPRAWVLSRSPARKTPT